MQTTETQEAKGSAQQAEQPGCPMQVEPQQEHHWLHKLVGNWTAEGEATMEPGKPPVKWTSTETVRSVGGLWVIGEGQGEMPGGGSSTTIITLGYDPKKKQYVGTFIGSMMAHLWVYEGAMDASGTVLTLEAEGPDMADPGRHTKYRDIVEFRNNDHRLLSSQILGEDGQWHGFMTAHYRRTK